MHSLDDRALDQLFRTARTRKVWSDRPVPPELIREIYELAKLGPTSFNSCPARFVWVTSAEAKEQLAACALAPNQERIRKAPVTVIVGRDKDFAERLPQLAPQAPHLVQLMKLPAWGPPTAVRNATLQGAYLMLAARALGLDCGPMSGIDLAAIDAAFFAGTNVETDFICTLGYGADENLAPRQPRLAFEEVSRIV